MNEKFFYNYSSKKTVDSQNEKNTNEIIKIKNKYDKNCSEYKMAKLKKIDRTVNLSSSIIAIFIGIVGTICLATWITMIIRILRGISIVSIGLMIITTSKYLYKFILNKNKKKYGKIISKLVQDLQNS